MVQLLSFWTLSIVQFLFKTHRFGDWILSPSSDKSWLSSVQSIKLVPITGPPETGDRRQDGRWITCRNSMVTLIYRSYLFTPWYSVLLGKPIVSQLLQKAPRHEDVWGSGDIAPPFSTSGLDEGKWSASYTGRLIPDERSPGTHCIGRPQRRSGHKVKRKISRTCWESKLESLAVRLRTWYWWRSMRGDAKEEIEENKKKRGG
jgi:hypothetical protein